MTQLEKARSTVPGIELHQADIQDPSTIPPGLAGQFDAVFSSAVFHWCKRDPGGVLESCKKLLKPGGRLVVEMGGFGNM